APRGCSTRLRNPPRPPVRPVARPPISPPTTSILAPHASAPQPERSLHLGEDGAAGRRLAPSTSKLPPLAKCVICRQTLEVRTGCPNWARPGLCGGRLAITVPTSVLS